MAAAWDVSDTALTQSMEGIKSFMLEAGDGFVYLYRNDYTPVPGCVTGDFTPADYPGAAPLLYDAFNWGSVTVTDHVAICLSGEPYTFTADAGSWSPQVIFGYLVVDGSYNLLWAERFSTPRTIGPSESLILNLEFRCATYPYSS